MQDKTKICPYCGATVPAGDGLCPSCWKKLTDAPAEQDGVLEGYNRSQWVAFIGKNADRYVSVFEKHEGKRWFVHFNWMAALFSTSWMFYRKMYRYAIIAYVLSFLLTSLFVMAALVPQKQELREMTAAISAYEEYVDQVGVIDMSTEVVRKGIEAERRLVEMYAERLLLSLLILPAEMAVFGLFGDWLYRQHVRRHITEPKSGGTSWGAWVGGNLLCSAIESVVLSPVLSLITAIVLG